MASRGRDRDVCVCESLCSFDTGRLWVFLDRIRTQNEGETGVRELTTRKSVTCDKKVEFELARKRFCAYIGSSGQLRFKMISSRVRALVTHITVLESRSGRWAEHVALQHVGDRLAGKPQLKTPFGTHAYRWEDNINMDIKEIQM